MHHSSYLQFKYAFQQLEHHLENQQLYGYLPFSKTIIIHIILILQTRYTPKES